MSIFQAFRRQPVPSQMAQQLRAVTLPALTRGIILSENYAYMQPGGCMVCDNWRVTMRGIQLRGGSIRWCDLFDNGVDPPPPLEHLSRKPIISAFEYASGNEQKMFRRYRGQSV